MEIIDITMQLSEDMVIYEGDPGIGIRTAKTVAEDGVMLSKIQMGVHTGTHVDAPAHFIDCAKTIDKAPLSQLVTKARVCEFSANTVTGDDLKECGLQDGEALLLKTENSDYDENGVFEKGFAHLDESAADYLVEKGVKTVGIDYLSIEKFHSSHVVHRKLLGSDMVIIEGLRLKDVEPGVYDLICLPLNIRGVEAAPARCILTR